MNFPKNMEVKKRREQNIVFWLGRFMAFGIIAILFLMLFFILKNGISVLSWEFISENPRDGMTAGGIFPVIVGTVCLMVGSMLFAVPVGVLAGIYVNEYATHGKMKRFVTLMTDNLAGVPSIVFGLFGMALFVNYFGFGASILAGSLTLGILALPIIIRTTEESLKAVDDTFRHASYALGASKLYTIRKVVLPIALPNIITGIILSFGRVSGETAPILFTVAAYFLPRLPESVYDQCMALPYHLYVLATSGTQIEQSRPMAYGTAVVLILIVLAMNIFAALMRNYYQKKVKMN